MRPRHQFFRLAWLGALAIACQAPNPAFDLPADAVSELDKWNDSTRDDGVDSSAENGDASGIETEADTETMPTSSSSGDASTTDNNSDSSTADSESASDSSSSDSTNATTDASDASTATTSTITDSSSTSESTQSSGTGVSAYCTPRPGLENCYTLDEIIADQVRDDGPGGFNLDVSNAVIYQNGSSSTVPTNFGVRATASTLMAASGHVLPTLPNLGVEIWFNMDLTHNSMFDAILMARGKDVAIELFLGGDIACLGYDDGGGLHTVVLAPASRNAAIHVACGYDGEALEMWLDGTTQRSAPYTKSTLASSTYLALGNSPGENNLLPFVGYIYSARVWTDVAAMIASLDAEL